MTLPISAHNSKIYLQKLIQEV
uniref:Uncharacterized protein n=1 Tax=Anguilla anguilla TaxID=7936 RepID=A0A0E9XTN8_ANGAN